MYSVFVIRQIWELCRAEGTAESGSGDTAEHIELDCSAFAEIEELSVWYEIILKVDNNILLFKYAHSRESRRR